MVLQLARDLQQSRSIILTELVKSGLSLTARKITKHHGYKPHGTLLYVPGYFEEEPRIKRDFWFTLFLDDIVYSNTLPVGYKCVPITIKSQDDSKWELTLVYKGVETIMIDYEGHFGLLPHSKNLSGLQELADHYNIRPVPREPPSAFKDFIEGLDVSGV